MILRNLPSIDKSLKESEHLIAKYGRSLTVYGLRTVMDEIRKLASTNGEVPGIEFIIDKTEKLLIDLTAPTIKPVINATGVVLHTNLGRAPLSRATIEAMDRIACSYTNLEFDLETGKRGSRLGQVDSLLKYLTGAESGLVVNNCASAVLLVLTALAKRGKVILSRSELVEIGGGFRIPDVMIQSGARLVEIGTTNKVKLSDYQEVLNQPNSSSRVLVMRVHRSNFKILGFTEEPELKSIIDLTHQHNSIFVEDLGSGALLKTENYGLEHEPTVQESILAGADLVLFSGDKLLGGPQAGIIVGKEELIAKLRKHPLTRALRADKLCIAGLSATLLHYVKEEADKEIPIWKKISKSPESLKLVAESWKQEIGFGEVIDDFSTIGGGSMPGEMLPTSVLSIQVKSTDKFLRQLRENDPPIIARTQNDRILFDPRTISDEEYDILVRTVKSILIKNKP